MTFTTATFLLFLVIVFGLYWTLRRVWTQNVLIVLASFFFYGWWDYRFAGLLLISCLVDYGLGLALERTERSGARRLLLTFSLLVNFGLLGFFKYFNFFTDNLAASAAALGWTFDRPTLEVVLPVGISFYTFQTVSYTIDIYRREMPATKNLIDYLAYVSFFPQLVAGPIERAQNLLPQMAQPRTFDYAEARMGLRQMLWGFFKKMVIADNLATMVNGVYADPRGATGPQLALATFCFAFQIYCDFSAYSDIAIGTGKLFGIRLMRNFAYPYFSQTVAEFWRRWHISLSTWFRDYLYFPLGGSRVPKPRQLFNVLVTFVVSGLWHGASWNFIIWGAINGLGMIPAILNTHAKVFGVRDTPGGERYFPPLGTVLRMTRTFLVICAGWVFFRAATLGDALHIFYRIGADLFSPRAYAALIDLFDNYDDLGVALIHLAILAVIEWTDRRFTFGIAAPGWPRWARWAAYTVVIYDILYYGTRTRSEFIYFQF